MFAGNTMLLPKSMTTNPDVFNKGQPTNRVRRQVRSSFRRRDKTVAQRITLNRNPKWWGTRRYWTHHLPGAR